MDIPNNLDCEVEWLEITDFKPHPENPNRHNPEGVEAIAGALREHGWRKPIVRSRQTGLCTKGHGRHAAAASLGATQYPCQWQDYASEQEEREDLLADNQVAQETQVIADRERKLMKELQERGKFTGHRKDEIERAMQEVDAAKREQDKTPPPQRQEFTTIRLHYRGSELPKIRKWLGDQGKATQPEQLLRGLRALTPDIKTEPVKP